MRKRSGFFAYWPSQIKVFIMLLILAASGILLAAADYGESSDSLGQITDEFDTLDNVSVRVLIERNATLNAMELNLTVGTGGPEDLTSWIEVDVTNDLTVNETHVEFDTLRRDSDSLIYRDWGAGPFGDFMINASLFVSDVEAGDASNVVAFYPLMIGNAATKDGVIAGEGAMIEMYQVGSTDDRLKYTLRQRKGGAWTITINDASIYGTPITHYISLYRVGAQLTLDVFSDAARTVRIEHLTSGGADLDTYQYSHAAIGYSALGDPANHVTGSVSLIDLGASPGSTYATEGYFTTTDQLAGINGSVLVQLTNATIPAGTGITAEFSVDNSTWVNPTALTAGFQSIDLRDQNWSTAHYVRYNMSGTGADTPRLYQSRLVTTEGPAGAAGPGAPGMNVSRETVLYNLTEIGVTVGTLDSGDLNSTLDIDGDTYNVSELVGAPGFQISGNFSGVDPDADCLWVVLYAHYDGNQAHDLDIEIWNFTSSAFIDISHITDGIEFSWFNASIYALRIPNEFLSGEEVRVRIEHADAGNINHDLFIEYFKLLAETPAGPPPGAGAGTVIIESDFPWIAIAIILMCVAYLLFRPK